MNVFIPIMKVDEQRREVWGVAAEEAPDKSGELMDYSLSKPRFEAWSKSISDATQGKSLGNVRAMHQPIAAGKVIAMQFDDDAKKIFVGTKIIDDNEWKKVTEGVYTGFSVGGRYGVQKHENGILRYEAIPSEVSIVDNPCMHGATFTMVKADGMTEQRPFLTSDVLADGKDKAESENNGASFRVTLDGEAIATRSLDINKINGTSIYTSAPANNLYLAANPLPIADIYNQLQQHVESLDKAGARHSASDQKLVQAIHDSACSLGGVCVSMDKADAGDLKKDIMNQEPAWRAYLLGFVVSDVAGALQLVSELASLMIETDPESAGKLSAAAQLITSALNDKVAEQAVATQAAAVDAAQDEALEEQVEAKAENATPAASDASVNDATTPANESSSTDNAPASEGDMSKTSNADFNAFKADLIDNVKALLKEFTTAAAAPLQKAELASTDLAKRFDEVTARLGAFEGRIEKLEKLPAGTGPILREVGSTVANEEDALIASLDRLIEEESDPNVRQSLMAKRAQAAIKQAYRAGGNRIR